MKKYILAIDAGTSSSRALLFDHQGNTIALEQEEFTQYFPHQGWVEHDANEIWDTQLRVLQRLLQNSGVSPEEIAAVGITNQRETTVVWDRKTGTPVGKAIVWQDRRTADFCEHLQLQGKAPLFYEKTGLVLDAYFSGTKIRWILNSKPEIRTAAEKGTLAFGTIDSWLIWKLTQGKVHVTDATNASRTLLFNIHTQKWDDELLDLLEVPKSLLAKVVDSSEVVGTTAEELLGAALPIAGIAGDQQAALFGQLCTAPGTVKNTYGTGCFCIMNTGKTPVVSKNKMLTTIVYRLQGEVTYVIEGSVFIAGALVQWLRDQMQLIESAAEIETLAETVTDNGGLTFVPAL
ncbi:MAG: FGGY family carbohydrate kinase, partial [Flavobacteriaceae bacterium]